MLQIYKNIFAQTARNSTILNNNVPVFNFSTQQMKQFTEVFDKKQADEQSKKVSSGRAWKANELRLKSSEELHKLWYVLLKEKNSLIADNAVIKKIHSKLEPQDRMNKVKVSMARLLTVENERKKIREQYRTTLENEYVEQQRQIYEQQLKEQQAQQVQVPEITHDLMREKYRDLRKGIDNTSYLQRQIDKENYHLQQRQILDEKYDYKNKKIVPQNYEGDDKNVIKQFTSMFDEQIKSGNKKISEQEVLRAHIKNWKALNLKQRRIIINFLQARRAKDAKKEFFKELDLLSQKIAYDEMQDRMEKQK